VATDAPKAPPSGGDDVSCNRRDVVAVMLCIATALFGTPAAAEMAVFNADFPAGVDAAANVTPAMVCDTATLVVNTNGDGAALGANDAKLGLKQMMGCMSGYRSSMRLVIVYETPLTTYVDELTPLLAVTKLSINMTPLLMARAMIIDTPSHSIEKSSPLDTALYPTSEASKILLQSLSVE
jgi:hypothetical protein